MVSYVFMFLGTLEKRFGKRNFFKEKILTPKKPNISGIADKIYPLAKWQFFLFQKGEVGQRYYGKISSMVFLFQMA